MNRRNFITAAATATLGAAPLAGQTAESRGRVAGANDRVRIGLIGCGGMGSGDLRYSLRVPNTQCVALCDVDDTQSAKVLKEVAEPAGQKPELVTRDFRRILDRKDVDAVIAAVPDNWHALCTVMACQAGKDVYVEKPMALTVWEGRQMVEASRKYNRIVQLGNQRRSGTPYPLMAEYIASGKLGKIRFVRSWAYLDWIGEIPPLPDSDPPPTVDYDMWLGPAPKRPFNKNRFHFTFRWYWDYANGMVTDWGAHLLDVCRWIMGAGAPLSAVATGGKLGYPNDSMETPDTLQVSWEFPEFILMWEHAIGIGRGAEACEHGIEVHGNNGVLVMNSDSWRVYSETENLSGKRKYSGEQIPPQPLDSPSLHQKHHENFIKSLRERSGPVSDLENGHLSMIAMHLANISHRVGRRVRWDAANETIPGDAEAAKYLTREYRAPWKLVV